VGKFIASAEIAPNCVEQVAKSIENACTTVEERRFSAA